jgi:DNA processing protein
MTDAGVRPLRRPADLLREPRRSTGRHATGERAAPRAWPPGFAASDQDRAALVVLAGLPSMTAARLLELSASAPSAAGCLAAVRQGLGGSDADQAVAAASDADAALAAVLASDTALVAVGDPAYPVALLDLFDPPPAIFVRGVQGWSSQSVRSVGIVGARNCSSYGVEMAHTLAAALAGAGLAVVSGAARGIDSAAHRGALDGGGPTIAVLGCGLDRPYPPGNRKLLDAVAASGAVVSEYAPQVRAEPFRFPARNRLIAALGQAVVVVEGTRGSGSMITAEHALELGRQVLAVPGPVTSELSQAPLALIREGAGLVRGPADLLDDLGMVVNDGLAEGSKHTASDGTEGHGRGPWAGGWTPSPDEQAVLRALAGAQPADAVAAVAGLPLPRVLSLLVGLELRGAVRAIGGRFERTLRGPG